jgi:hypothetical protein
MEMESDCNEWDCRRDVGGTKGRRECREFQKQAWHGNGGPRGEGKRAQEIPIAPLPAAPIVPLPGAGSGTIGECKERRREKERWREGGKGWREWERIWRKWQRKRSERLDRERERDGETERRRDGETERLRDRERIAWFGMRVVSVIDAPVQGDLDMRPIGWGK